MNPLISQRLHVGVIGILIALTLIRLVQNLGEGVAPALAAYSWFWIVNSAAVAALLGVRLRQLLVQSIVAEPKPGIETYAVGTGQGLIVLGVLGLIAAFVMNLGTGLLRGGLLNAAATACLWLGLACIELVIANGRSAVLPPDQRPSGGARFVVGMFILFAGFVLGITAFFVVLAVGMRH